MSSGEVLDITEHSSSSAVDLISSQLNPNLSYGELYAGFPPLGNPDLPINARKDEIIAAMNGHSAVVLVSPTGTGKSSQMGQFALEAGFTSIIQTQPRRRAAENVSTRISEELGVVVGEDRAAELVSFQTGAGLVGSRDARIKVVTDGLLVVQDAYQPTDGDNEVWIIDEAHENGKDLWLLLGLAKQKRAENPNFTVVVMSAHVDKYKIVSFLTDENGQEPAVIELEATMFAVEEREEPHSDTVNETVRAIMDIYENPDAHDSSNTIQVFEAGKQEIKDTIDAVIARLPAAVLAETTLLAGHAKMTPQALAPIYEDTPGIKVVIQTNMGKTSMTIPRTRYVITSGEERQTEIDEEDIIAPRKRPSSQDCMHQERGRAGRTSTGIFIHTKHDGEPFIPMDERDPHLTPEILRTNIDRIVLYLAMRGTRIREFDGPDDIPDASMSRAIHRMQALGALDQQGDITPYGRKVIKYPTSPENGGSMVAAEKHGLMIRAYMAAMVAITEAGGIRSFEYGRTTNWDQLSNDTSSDAFAQLDMFIAIQGKKLKEMDELDIDTNNFLRTDELYRKIARRAGIDQLPDHLITPSAAERETLRECILAGHVNSVYLPYGDGLFKKIGESLHLREVSTRSVVRRHTRTAVIGEARNIEVYEKGKRVLKPILENVTEIPIDRLGRLATQLTEWVPTGFKLRRGGFVQEQRQVLGSRTLDFREVTAEPSPQLRAAVIEHVKVRPGKSLVTLYQIKKELERLAHKAKNPILRLTEDKINEYIERATPETVTDPSHVEENLRQLIVNQNLRLESFVTTEQRARILLDAPDEKKAGNYTFKLRYSNGKAFVKRYTPQMIAQLDDELTLDDGRQIFFVHGEKRYTLSQLKNKLRDEDAF